MELELQKLEKNINNKIIILNLMLFNEGFFKSFIIYTYFINCIVYFNLKSLQLNIDLFSLVSKQTL